MINKKQVDEIENLIDGLDGSEHHEDLRNDFKQKAQEMINDLGCNKDFEITKNWKEKGKEITETVTTFCCKTDFVEHLCNDCKKLKERLEKLSDNKEKAK